MFTISLVLVPSILLGMEGESDPKRARVEDAQELNLEEKVSLCEADIKTCIGDFDLASISTLLASEEAAELSKEQREALYQMALEKEHVLLMVLDLESEGFDSQQEAQHLIDQATDEVVENKFSLINRQHKQAKKIRCVMHAAKVIKQFRFPQAHFNPRPYRESLRPSLDQVLEGLIVNEQEKISVCCFHLTLFNVAARLVEQKKEGIKIAFVTNRTQGDSAPLQAIEHLMENGIVILAPLSRSFETNHHKFFIFSSNLLNKALIWSGSYNATGHSNENPWEDVTIQDDPHMVQSYRERFKEIRLASQRVEIRDFRANRTPSDFSLRNNNVPAHLWQ